MRQLAIRGGTPVRDRPFPAWPVHDESEVAAVAAVIRSGRWWRGAYEHRMRWDIGEPRAEAGQVAELEQRFAALHRAHRGIAVATGSAALDIAVAAAGLEPGAEVITTPYTYIATAACIVKNRCRPVFADIEPATLNLDPAAVAAACTPRTRAVIVVHFAGQPVDLTAIQDLTRQRGLILIEDAAHAILAEHNGCRVGTWGRFACFSFQASKNLSTGEGGMILTTSDADAERCYSLQEAGRRPGGAWCEHDRIGWNYRLSELHAALGLVQLARLEQQQRQRDQAAADLCAQLAQIPGISPLVRLPETTRHGWHLLVLRFDPASFGGLSRRRFTLALNAEGIPCTEGYAQPLDALPIFAGNDAVSPCSNAVAACQEVVWLPQQILLGERADLDQVVEAITKIQRFQHELGGRRREP